MSFKHYRSKGIRHYTMLRTMWIAWFYAQFNFSTFVGGNMSLFKRFLIIVLLASASCGSTRSGVYRPAPVFKDSTTQPVIVPEDSATKKPVKKYGQKNYGPLKVSLLLPLNIEGGKSNMDPFLADYYEGVMMGLDSLRSLGMDVVVNVYDTKGDTAAIRKLTWKKELAESNLIIGPTFKAGYAMLSKYTLPRKITLVSPFSNAYLYSDSNKYSVYCTPDDKGYAMTLARFIKEKYPNANLLLFNDGSQEDKDFIWRFKVVARDSFGLSKWRDVTYNAALDMTTLLKQDSVNIIFAPTGNEKIASQLLTQLKDPAYNNILITLESWLDFKHLSFQTYELWGQNRLHVLTSYYINDFDGQVINFKIRYKNKYGAYPSGFAVRGFDHILAFGCTFLDNRAETIAEGLQQSECRGMHNRFIFRSNGKILENRGVNIIEFKNHRFQRIE